MTGIEIQSSSMRKTKPRLTYLSTLKLIADQSRRELHALMPHRGELGRITEEIIKGVLDRTLPKRFSIGTGVIINASGDTSAQTDIVIYDNFFNCPLFSEYGARLFPVEYVYATIEVKSVLTFSGLKNGLADIMRLRKIGSAKQYIVNQKPLVVTTPPRNYIVGFRQRGLGKNYDQIKTKLEGLLNESNSHVHGVCILQSDWFAMRKAYTTPAVLLGENGNSLTQLYRSILIGQENFLVYPMNVRAHLGEDA
jgi:hypothetical protein